MYKRVVSSIGADLVQRGGYYTAALCHCFASEKAAFCFRVNMLNNCHMGLEVSKALHLPY